MSLTTRWSTATYATRELHKPEHDLLDRVIAIHVESELGRAGERAIGRPVINWNYMIN